MDNLSLRGGPMCVSSGLLTATGGVTTYDTTATIEYTIDGSILRKTAITTGTTPTTDIVSGALFSLTPLLPSTGAIVLWGLNAAGTVVCTKSRHFALDVNNSFIVAPEFPPIPKDFAPFAYQVLKASSAASASGVVFGTANWNATGFTNTIKNVAWLPSRPQVS